MRAYATHGGTNHRLVGYFGGKKLSIDTAISCAACQNFGSLVSEFVVRLLLFYGAEPRTNEVAQFVPAQKGSTLLLPDMEPPNPDGIYRGLTKTSSKPFTGRDGSTNAFSEICRSSFPARSCFVRGKKMGSRAPVGPGDERAYYLRAISEVFGCCVVFLRTFNSFRTRTLDGTLDGALCFRLFFKIDIMAITVAWFPLA